MALDERVAASSDGHLRQDEIVALTARIHGTFLWGVGTPATVLTATLGFLGNRLWTTVTGTRRRSRPSTSASPRSGTTWT